MRYFATLLLACLLIACSSPLVGVPENGKRWYFMHNCYACHGKNANNGKAPKIAGLHMNYSNFNRRLRNAKSAIMPEYPDNKISDQDVADILSWLKSLE